MPTKDSTRILEKLHDLDTKSEKYHAVATTERKDIYGQLKKLNGKVADHEKRMQGQEKNTTVLFDQFNRVYTEYHDSKVKARSEKTYWLRYILTNVLWAVGVLIVAALAKTGVINL